MQDLTNDELIKEKIISKLYPSLDGALERIMQYINSELKSSHYHYNVNQKRKIIKYLDECGIFLLRDSVNYIAKSFEISRVSVYKYIRKE